MKKQELFKRKICKMKKFYENKSISDIMSFKQRSIIILTIIKWRV
ncbi:hypothetical protein CJD_1589 [Clostridium perfringens D str. JGS1721]|uniref:Uncharacterized protein n=1 Tax=Clostridium perfringens D str. JGS1721 TaxID=488537 RepID=B1V6F9_CLOPF|nr:hypothetical protein CJD_1589 [Clostridium perfringens D str. JGS1721]